MNFNTSPFKFLDSYEQKDVEIFFGREEETEELYNALSGVKHLLVYGPSGAGKTSLIECGLRNQFSDADWYALSIRKGEDMLASSFAAINHSLKKKLDLDEISGLPKESGVDLSKAIQRLFSQRFQPIYLLFDQFEELLISGGKAEKEEFFREIDKLIRYRVPCRVLFIMREEFIGHLSEFEHLCPSIFEHRFRLEKMTRGRVEKVIHSILEAEYYEDYFEVEESQKLAEQILKKLPDTRSEIDLSHVQVYLSELWDRSIDRGGFGTDLPSLDTDLIKSSDNLREVLDSFLKKQLSELDLEFGDGTALEVLAVMISERNTKLQVNEGALRVELQRRGLEIGEELMPLLDEFEVRRIIRKVRAAGMAQFEISHDTLAQVVGRNLTEEMKLRQKAQDYYRLYREREGLLGREDINLLRFYSVYLPLPKDLEKKMLASERQIREEEEREVREALERAEKEKALREDAESNARRARQRTLVAGLVALVALFAAFVAYNFYNRSETQKTVIQIEKERSDSLLVQAVRSDSIAQDEKKKAVQALADFKAEQKLRLSEEEKRLLADKKRVEAQRKNVDKILSDAEDLVKAGYKSEARKLLREKLVELPGNRRLIRKLNNL